MVSDTAKAAGALSVMGGGVQWTEVDERVEETPDTALVSKAGGNDACWLLKGEDRFALRRRGNE